VGHPWDSSRRCCGTGSRCTTGIVVGALDDCMLLRALETGMIQAVGASGPRCVHVRLVSATDASLHHRSRRGAP
jgi:hypothetical protein